MYMYMYHYGILSDISYGICIVFTILRVNRKSFSKILVVFVTIYGFPTKICSTFLSKRPCDFTNVVLIIVIRLDKSNERLVSSDHFDYFLDSGFVFG